MPITANRESTREGAEQDGQSTGAQDQRPTQAAMVAGFRLLEVTISILTLLILVAGLAFAVMQTQHSRVSVERVEFNALESNLQQVNRIFIQYPELQKYFLSGADITKADANYNRVYAIAVMIAMNMDESTSDLRGNRDLLEPGTWHDYYRFQFGASPILCRLLLQDHDLYSDRIVAIARHDCLSAPPRPINPQ